MCEEATPEESITHQILCQTLDDLSPKDEFPDELIEELRSIAFSGKFVDATEIRRVLDEFASS
jgi:hypothetical protein